MSEQSITSKPASDPTNSDSTSRTDNPFSTIESAQDFVKLLTKAVDDATQELQVRTEESGSEVSRRLDALRIALYSLAKLESHLHQSSRILNDLRTLRRLMLAEREIKSNISSSKMQREADKDGSAEGTETLPPLDQLSS